MTRTHTTVIVYFNIDTHNKNEVACIHNSIFTSISIHLYIYYKWETPIICTWTRGLRNECAFRGQGSTNKSCNVNVSTTSFLALTILGFVHVNLIVNFFIFCHFTGWGWLCFSPFFYRCLLWHCHIWLQTFYFLVRLRLIQRPEKIVTASVYVVSHPQMLLTSLFLYRQILLPTKVDEIL